MSSKNQKSKKPNTRISDDDARNCTGGEAAFQHKVSGKILTANQVKEGANVVGGRLLQDGTIDPDRFPWTPIQTEE